MKKVVKILIGSLFSICILLGLGYLGLAVYYENGFSFQTYINGIYCTGKSVETVNKELNEAYEYEGLTVNAMEGSFYIDANDISYVYDYREPLNHYLAQQNPYLWIENLTKGHKEYTLLPAVCFSHADLEEMVSNQIETFALKEEHFVKITSDANGFFLLDTKQDILDEEKTLQFIKEALVNGVDSINLEEAGCYYDEPYTEVEKELMSFYDLLNEYQTRTVSYVFGDEKETFSKGDLAQTLICFNSFSKGVSVLPNDYETAFLDENGKLIINDEDAGLLVENKLTPYSTYRNHEFTTHDGRILTIKGGNYGNQIAMKTEKKELLSFLYSDERTYTREPVYSKEVAIKGKNDIGDTYIEVDIGQQKMFYYRDGKLYLETDVVTGKNKATPEGVNYVYAKQKNRVLRGPGYASPVKYWMPVNGGIGIHDASWRDEYGGDIYIRNGSHGCINTPLEIVEKMYEVMEIGTPCVMYYGLDEEK